MTFAGRQFPPRTLVLEFHQTYFKPKPLVADREKYEEKVVLFGHFLVFAGRWLSKLQQRQAQSDVRKIIIM